MENENIQELKFQVGEAWKGVYSSSTAYGLANVVQDPTGLSIYRSLKSGNVDHPVSDRTWWFCIIDMSSIKAESDRIAALNQAIAQDEALRVAAEELRQQHETERIAAETQRNEAEQARVNAEQERVGAESARATAEQQRITAEEGRVSAESARVQAEQARVLAETLRVNAEDQRAANEQNRVAAEQQRIERAESDHQRVESDLADIAVYTDSLGAFDLSKHNAVDGVLATYADLSAALTALNALDSKYKYGGMSFKFVLTSDNKYVLYFLTKDEWSANEADWAIADEGVYVENPEFLRVWTDESDNILIAIEKEGNIVFGYGVPKQVIEYITEKIKELNLSYVPSIVAFLDGLINGGNTLQQLLNVKVDKVGGKGLIDEDYASSQSSIENPEWLSVETDASDNILSGTRKDGSHYIRRVESETIPDKNDFVLKKQNVSDSGKVLGINDSGDVNPVDTPTLDELGGLPKNQGATNAGKILQVGNDGNVRPVIDTPSGTIDGVVKLTEQVTLYLGAELIDNPTVVLGTGWSGSLTDGFSHTPGSDAPIEIQVPTTSGKKYLIGLTLGAAQEASLYVSIGDTPLLDVYNGNTDIKVGILSDGGYLKITPFSTFSSTVSNISVKEVVPQEESESSYTTELLNVDNGQLTQNITGFWNIAIGSMGETLHNITNGSRNIALGYATMMDFTTGNRNIAIGTFAMQKLFRGSANIAIGADVMWKAPNISNSVAIGPYSLNSMTLVEITDTVAIGNHALGGTSKADNKIKESVGIGYYAGTSTNGIRNVSIGKESGFYAGDYSVAIGYRAGYWLKGNNNVAIGSNTYQLYVTGANNTLLGTGAKVSSDSASASNIVTINNAIAIGYDVHATKSNQCVIGNSSVTEFVFGNKKLVFNNDNSITWESI